MATKPLLLPEWASGGLNTVEPSGAEKIAGWGVEQEAPSDTFNWLQNLTWKWLAYLSDQVFSGLTTLEQLLVTGTAHFEDDVTFDTDLIANTIHASSNISSASSIYATGSVNAPYVYQSGNRTHIISRNHWTDFTSGAALAYVLTGSYPAEQFRRKLTAGGRAVIVIDGLPGTAVINRITVQVYSSSAGYTTNLRPLGGAQSTTPAASVTFAPTSDPTFGFLQYDNLPATYEGSKTLYYLLVEASGGADMYFGDVIVRYTEPHP